MVSNCSSSLRTVFVVLLLWAKSSISLKCEFKEVWSNEENDQLCGPESDFCYALWNPSNETISGDGSSVNFIKQGCWGASPKSQCENTSCIAKVTKGTKKENLFCCCTGDYCNSLVAIEEVDELPDLTLEEEGLEEDAGQRNRNLYIILGGVLLLILIIVMVGLGSHLWWKRKDLKCKVDNVEAGQQLLEPQKEKDWKVAGPLVLGQEIARGKFGTVYTGKCAGSKVAFKVFSSDQRDYFDNENFIYQLLEKCQEDVGIGTDTKNIIRYFGYNEYTASGSPNLIVVLQKITPGTLRDILNQALLTVPQITKMLKGIANGLSFLHGENKERIIIAHRDMTSKNILVDGNFTPYLSDFGLSLRINGSKYYFAGEEHLAELIGLSEVGTQRYMAPELLDGAVNLKDCENALKQMDIYSLALIIWEVANVCPEIRLSGDIKYVLPYEVEIGKEITKENLTRFVVTRRDRPSFVEWRDSPLTRSIRETLTDCWDPEPDARLTALCVVERLSDIGSLSSKTDSTTPLEVTNTTSSWIARNSCLERNLLDRSDDKSSEYLLQSEKHKFSSFYGNSSTEGESVVTQHTDLSNGSGLTHDIVSPATIPYLHNISRN